MSAGPSWKTASSAEGKNAMQTATLSAMSIEFRTAISAGASVSQATMKKAMWGATTQRRKRGAVRRRAIRWTLLIDRRASLPQP